MMTKKSPDSIEREIIRDLLGIVTLNVTLSTGEKVTRSEALRHLLLDYYKNNPMIIDQVNKADSKREEKVF